MNFKIKNKSLGFKINAIFLTAILMLAFIFCSILYFTGMKLQNQKYTEINTLLDVLFEQNREDIANEIFAEQYAALRETLNAVLKVKGVAGVNIFDTHGKSLMSAGIRFLDNLSKNEMHNLDQQAVFEQKSNNDPNTASYSSDIKVIGEKVGYIKIYYDFRSINNQFRRVMIIFIALFITIFLLISWILYFSLSRFIITPVLTLKNAMEKVDNGILGIKVDISAQDEIGEMGAVFNKMSETLCQNDASLRRAVKTEADYSLKLENANNELNKVNFELENSNSALEKLNKDLENTVAERTSDLMASNTILQREIDENRRMRKELLRTQKLESVGLLAGGIAHDFNNILSVVIGNLSLVRMHTGKDDKITQFLQETEKACFRARDLTKQLLTFSKGGAPVTKIMAITGLIQETVIFALRGSSVSPEFSIPSNLLPAKVDEGQINQAISNIIINASQAMVQGGLVKVTARNMDIKPDNTPSRDLEPGPYIKLTIQDNGPGIPQEDLQNIFDPYFTTKPKGSGLGLATTYSIIEKHKGFITVQSQMEKGTAFHIYLPASMENNGQECDLTENPEIEFCPDNVQNQSRSKILVMDDEEMIREVVGELLTYLGYDPDFAEDGVEACKKYSASMAMKNKFHAVIMDLTIPGGMGGREAIKEILKIDPQANVIVSSGYSNNPVMANYKSYGFSGIVAKPFKLQELNSVLRQTISLSTH